jgi:hypothetical protein
MSTTLQFEAPADLSVGRVRIEGEQGVIAEWVATPGARFFEQSEVEPGFYMAEIAPTGVRPQSIIFEVKPDTANTIVSPVFSALSAEGNGMTFVDVEDRERAIAALSRGEQAVSVSLTPSPEAISAPTSVGRSAETKRRLTLGLAHEAASGKEDWRPFDGEVSPQLGPGGLNLFVLPDECAVAAGRRARLSLALEHVRLERLLLPLYKGGTAVSVTPSSMATCDVELEVAPVDSELRALLRAVAAGTADDATAVRDRVLRGQGLGPSDDGPMADPWGRILAGLLMVRFPDIFEPEPGWAEPLVRSVPWAYDAHVLHARQLLSCAGPKRDERREAARQAAAALAKAQALGAPYFAYTNQIIGEMLGGLASLTDLESKLQLKLQRLLRRWQRDLPLQRVAGATFTWQRRDAQQLKKGILLPDRKTSGGLDGRHGRIVFRGRVALGWISLDTAARKPPKAAASSSEAPVLPDPSPVVPADVQTGSLSRAPAEDRSVIVRDDPNKGRFGGRAVDGGFALSAQFEPASSKNWVSVTLVVEADESNIVGASCVARFCLHPTFSPHWITATFRGRRASVTLKAWGGFTVGVWLPAQGIELELDLATLPDAPPIIRDL